MPFLATGPRLPDPCCALLTHNAPALYKSPTQRSRDNEFGRLVLTEFQGLVGFFFSSLREKGGIPPGVNWVFFPLRSNGCRCGSSGLVAQGRPTMASLTSSSHRSSSSSSYRSSARYSSSSSYRSDGSLGGSSDSLDPLFDSFLDSPDHSSLFGEDGPGAPSCLAPFGSHSRASYGHTGKGRRANAVSLSGVLVAQTPGMCRISMSAASSADSGLNTSGRHKY